MDQVNKESFISKIFRHLFTGRDGVSFDIGRVLWAVGTFALTFFEGYAVIYHSQPFDAVQYATGFAAILAAGGAALGFKAATEPDSDGRSDLHKDNDVNHPS